MYLCYIFIFSVLCHVCSALSLWYRLNRNEARSVIRIKVLHILSFVLSTNRQLYEVRKPPFMLPYDLYDIIYKYKRTQIIFSCIIV